MQIGGRTIGAGEPVFVVAELSGNHKHDWERTMRLVKAAKDAGADAVKGQCFTPGSMTLDLDDAAHRIVWQGRERTLHDLYAETAMPLGWHAKLMHLCTDLGMLYFASEFSPADVDFMDGLGAPCHKVASFELTDTPLIRHMAAKGKPVILSTGMASYREIVNAVYAADCETVWLKCTSAYPAPVNDANLSTLIAAGFPGTTGLSDHTRNNSVVAAAVALGACVVERHLTLRRINETTAATTEYDPHGSQHLILSRAYAGADAAFSDEPHEFAQMVRVIRDTSAALGKVHYGPTASEQANLRFRRSLWATQDIVAGDAFTGDNIACLRPLGGLEPAQMPKVLGTQAGRDYKRGEPLVL